MAMAMSMSIRFDAAAAAGTRRFVTCQHARGTGESNGMGWVQSRCQVVSLGAATLVAAVEMAVVAKAASFSLTHSWRAHIARQQRSYSSWRQSPIQTLPHTSSPATGSLASGHSSYTRLCVRAWSGLSTRSSSLHTSPSCRPCMRPWKLLQGHLVVLLQYRVWGRDPCLYAPSLPSCARLLCQPASP